MDELEILSENQREKSNHACREGLIAEGIIEYLRQCPDAIGSRQGTLDYLQDIVGLTDAERSAVHETDTRDDANYFQTKIDWVSKDLSTGYYPVGVMIKRDNGVWVLINFEISPQQVRESVKTYIERNNRKEKETSEERLALNQLWYKISTSSHYQARPEREKTILRKIGRPVIVEHVYLTGDDSEESINLLIEQYSL